MIARKFSRPHNATGFGGATKYILKPEKCSHSFGENVTSVSEADREMRLIANAAGAGDDGNIDPVIHSILSWSKHENPTNEQIEECVKDHINALGYERHQWIAAVHKDTDHTHVHMIINKIDPYTFRAKTVRDDFAKMDFAARESEIKQGWSHDNGIYSVEYIDGKPLIIEAKDRAILKAMSKEEVKVFHSDEKSFSQYIKETPAIENAISKSASWQEVHDRLSAFGIKINANTDGSGFTLSHQQSKSQTKLDNLEKLIGKIGDYQESNRGTEYEVTFSLDELTRTSAWFSEKDLDSYLMARISDATERDKLKKDIIESSECVHLKSQIKDGQKEGMPRFSTKAVISEEQECMYLAKKLSEKQTVVPTERATAKAISDRTMRSDQLDAFHRTLAAGGICTIKGSAGVGKSYMMTAAKDAYENSGYRVIGMGPTNEVTEAEKRDGFRETSTIDKALFAVKNGKLDWNSKTVLVVDEAGMISNDKMLQFLKVAEEHKVGKIILVGDPSQLPSIQRGGIFQDLSNKYSSGEITQITRQKESKQRDAAQAFSENRFEDGMALFHKSGRISWSGNNDDARESLLKKWEDDYKADQKSTKFVISYTNDDVDYFNNQIHETLKANSELSGFHDAHTIKTEHGKFEFCVNESIQFSKNDKKLGITNGLRGTISLLDKNGMTVDCDGGKKVQVSFNEFNHFRAGHAGTVYKSQGKSIENVYLHHTQNWKDAAGYVALTRQTKEATIFASKECARDWRDIARQMSSTMIKTTASSCEIASERHQTKPVRFDIDNKSAERLKRIAETRSESDPTKPEEPKVTRGQLYKAAISEQRKEWLEKVAAAKAIRDLGIGTMRLQNKPKNEIAEAKEKHKQILADIKPPSVKNYKSWLAENGHIAKQTPDELTKAKMVDLHKVMLMNEHWQRDLDRNDKNAVHYKNKNTDRCIVVKCDQTGAGLRWYEHEKKQGGGFDALAAELALTKEQQDRLIASAPEPKGELCDHRQLSFKSALALFDKARKPTGHDTDPHSLKGTVEKYDQNVKVINRPYGPVSMVASRNGNGDIVALEIISNSCQSITRASNDRAARTGAAVAERITAPQRQARQHDETPELRDALAAFRKMNFTRPTAAIPKDELAQAQIAADHLTKHAKTQTPTERLTMQSWSGHARELEHEKAELRKAEIEKQKAMEHQRAEEERRRAELERQRAELYQKPQPAGPAYTPGFCR